MFCTDVLVQQTIAKLVLTYDVQLLYEQHFQHDERLSSMLHFQPNQRLYALSCHITHRNVMSVIPGINTPDSCILLRIKARIILFFLRTG
jgi:hypothetical protein